MKPYQILFVVFAAVACMATSCEPDEPPEPETIYVGMPEIERQLFDFKPGSYWVMQNTLDTTQKDTFVRSSYSTALLQKTYGNTTYQFTTVVSTDTVMYNSPDRSISHWFFTSPYIAIAEPNNIRHLTVEYVFDLNSVMIPESLNMIQRTEILLPDSTRVRFVDTTEGSFVEFKKNVGLYSYAINDTVFELKVYQIVN